MLNQVIIMGRLTRDPESRTTQSGEDVTSFSVACERDTAKRETDFIDIVAWRKTAEFVQRYFRKGDMIAVSGRLQIREWTDKAGAKRRNAEVVADHAYFAASKRQESADFSPLPDSEEVPF